MTGVLSGAFALAGAISGIKGIVLGGSAAAWWVPGVGAIAAVVVVLAVLVYFAIERCDRNPGGTQGCMAGVIERITPAFTGSAADSLFPFSSPHDRVDVVVKQDYWDFIDLNSDYVFCSDADQSPMMVCFYYNPAVCNAAIGAVVGAAVSGAAGLVLAIGAVIAIGCAIWILCILALLIALIIAIVAAVMGAAAGGGLGRALTAQPGPTSTGSQLIPPQPLVPGDYVTTKGNLVKSGDLNNSMVFYFVTRTTLHGRSLSSPSFSHLDPDAHLVPDACYVNPPPPPPPPII